MVVPAADVTLTLPVVEHIGLVREDALGCSTGPDAAMLPVEVILMARRPRRRGTRP